MATPTDEVVVSPPKLIGTRTVALAYGIRRDHLRVLLEEGDPRATVGYVGRIGQRHVWNAHEMFAGMYSTPLALWQEIARIENGVESTLWCGIEECEEHARFLSLCRSHLNQIMQTWRHAETSSEEPWRLLAMCTWVVKRNKHLIPPGGWDPFSNVCMVPECDAATDTEPGRDSPLCPECSDKFWPPLDVSPYVSSLLDEH